MRSRVVSRGTWAWALGALLALGCVDLRSRALEADGSPQDGLVSATDRGGGDAAETARVVPDAVGEDRPTGIDALDDSPDAAGAVDITASDDSGQDDGGTGDDLPVESATEAAVDDSGIEPSDTGTAPPDDLPALDTGMDVPAADTGTDVAAVDAGMDALAVDSGVDVPRMDLGTDVPTVDARVDVPPDMPCATGFTQCGASCVNTMTNGLHCGRCGRACTGGQVCSAGSCACPTGQTTCSGACTSTQSDVAHCGMCGRACSTGQSCIGGTCVTLPAGDACNAPATLTLANGVATAMGDTTMATHQSGISTCENLASPDVFYSITLARPSLVRASVTGVGFQPTVALRAAACAGGDLACSNAASMMNTTALTPVPAGTYVVIVGGRTTFDAGRFTLSVTATDQAPGDGCYAPIPLTLLPVTGSLERTATVSGDTSALSHHPGATCEDATAPDVFYSVTFARRTLLRATVSATGWQPTVAVRLAGCSGADVACGAGAASSNNVFVRVPAGSYVFMVGGRGASDRGPFTLSVSAADSPSNDDCLGGSSTLFAREQTVTGDTTFAFPDGIQSQCVRGNDVVFFHSGGSNDNYLITVVGTGWAPVVSGALTCNSCSRFNETCGFATATGSRLMLRASCVSLLVGGRTAADRGPFTMTISYVSPPPGDQCGNAPDYSGSATVPMTGNTTSAIHDDPGSCLNVQSGDVYVRVTLSATRNVTATVTATGWQPAVALRNGSCTGTQVACGNVAANSNRAAFQLPAGTHYVVVGGRSVTDYGPFSLLVTATPP